MPATVNLAPLAKLRFVDNNGVPLAGGKVFTYVAGQTTKQATYTDASGATPNTNPVVLDSRGEAAIWFDQTLSYKVTLSPATDTDPPTAPIWTIDNIPAGNAQSVILAASGGSALVGYLLGLSGTVATTLLERNQREVSIFDWFTPTQIADAKTGAPTIDTTTPIQTAINVAAAAGRELIWEGTVLCGQITAAANEIRWRGRNGAKVLLKPAVYTSGTWHVTVSGNRPWISDIEFNGNMPAMVAGQGCNGLNVNGLSPTLARVRTRQCTGVGYTLYSANNTLVSTTTASYRKGAHIDCSFDDNGGLGMNTIAAAYHDFFGCTFDRNGYGFQKTRVNYADTSHGFVAFGLAVRLRSHHITFIGCWARDNGRDGMDVNQGSYAIKFIGCVVHGNDDGGFTIASDATGTGLPGESEACYDIEFIDCEAYNNYGSGLAAYNSCHNVSVVGGRYYNNHRCAGVIANQSSIYSGLYFAAGSTGINVDTKAYDDRQYRLITSVAGSTLAANGWTVGTMLYYPRVALYNASQVFQGYAYITAEGSGSVTISIAGNNSVVLANIVAGWYVTQALQHSGFLGDNNVNGSVAIDGFGHHPGVDSFSGRKIGAAYFAGGSNIILPKERQSQTELLTNPTFDSVVTGWTYNLTGGGTSTLVTSGNVRSAGALQLIGGTSIAIGDAVMVTGTNAAAGGEFVEFGGWVYATGRGDASILLFFNGSTLATQVDHPGGGWKYLKIGMQIPPGETGTFGRVLSQIGKTCFFDSFTYRAIEQHDDERSYNTVSRYLPV